MNSQNLAEGVGFEPTRRFYAPYSLSRRAPSASRSSLREGVSVGAVTRPIAVIAVTASAAGAWGELGRAGFDALETKPVSIAGLLRKIRTALGGRQPAAPPA